MFTPASRCFTLQARPYCPRGPSPCTCHVPSGSCQNGDLRGQTTFGARRSGKRQAAASCFKLCSDVLAVERKRSGGEAQPATAPGRIWRAFLSVSFSRVLLQSVRKARPLLLFQASLVAANMAPTAACRCSNWGGVNIGFRVVKHPFLLKKKKKIWTGKFDFGRAHPTCPRGSLLYRVGAGRAQIWGTIRGFRLLPACPLSATLAPV